MLNVIDQWVGDMKTSILGLQPRTRNIVTKIDEGSVSPGVSGFTSETPVSVQFGMQQIPTFETALVQLSPGPATNKIPENTIVTIVPEESDVWSRANTRP